MNPSCTIILSSLKLAFRMESREIVWFACPRRCWMYQIPYSWIAKQMISFCFSHNTKCETSTKKDTFVFTCMRHLLFCCICIFQLTLMNCLIPLVRWCRSLSSTLVGMKDNRPKLLPERGDKLTSLQLHGSLFPLMPQLKYISQTSRENIQPDGISG